MVGSSAGGYYSNGSYPPYEGLACGFAYTSGRIAGENAHNIFKTNNIVLNFTKKHV
ncbi:MAG: hypothetical protein ACLRQX_06000 [Turicibacter sanguinis]